ncbi:MAG: helix-turn-helix transcriptional regulator [Hyphomicrobium sp.]|nr:helix-turn-helix transcriptional regulator [Hyphomicrobium sp.]
MLDDTAPVNLKGRNYADQCASSFRDAITGLLNRRRQLLSLVMPPPTLGTHAWFAVVGVPLGVSKEGGALFVHMDISPWVGSDKHQAEMPSELSQGLLQRAMAMTLMGGEQLAHQDGRKPKGYYDGIESLTDRQREVLKLIGMGKSNVEIAGDLSCSINTVKRHVTAVLQKLKLPNRTRAAMLVNQIDRTTKE